MSSAGMGAEQGGDEGRAGLRGREAVEVAWLSLMPVRHGPDKSRDKQVAL